MKKLILLFILVSYAGFGQIDKKKAFILLQGGAATFNYTPRPTPPDFTPYSSTLLVAATVGSSVQQSELGTGVTRGRVDNPFAERLQTLQLVGSPDPYQFKGNNDEYSVVGGDVITSGQKVVSETGGTISDNYEYHRLLIKGNSNPATSGIIGMSFRSSLAGVDYKLSDLTITDVSSAGIQNNDGTSANKYGYEQIYFVRVIGTSSHYGTEGFYLGGTNTSSYSMGDSLVMYHNVAAVRGWDILQINSKKKIDVKYFTGYDGGKANQVGQRGLIQLQNVVGTVSNFVLWGAPDGGYIGSHGVTLTDGVMHWTGTNALLVQDMDLNAGYGSSVNYTGDSIIFRRVRFSTENPVSYAVRVQERTAHILFEDCTIGSNITNLVEDSRGASPGNTITVINTTTFNPPAPEFNSTDPNDPDSFLITTQWYKDRRIGARMEQ